MVFLVSAVAVCSAASAKMEMNDKNVKKRGLAEFHSGDFGSFPQPLGHFQQGGLVNFATPLLASLQAGGPIAGPFAGQLAGPWQTPVEKWVPNTHQIPVQFKTLVKNVPVPYERHIPIDNPIYTPVEHHVPIDNPVPVIKYVTQAVPHYVEQQVPIIKEERVPAPYVHKVRLIIQRVFVEEPQPQQQQQPQNTYLPPPPPSPVYGPPPQQRNAPEPSQNYLPPAPSHSYIPPRNVPDLTPPNTYIPPFRASPPAPPSTSYGVPEQRGYH